MPVLGIESVVYCVSEVVRSVAFFEDFGLRLTEDRPDRAIFSLPDTSQVIIQDIEKHAISGSRIEGHGVHEIVWGVDSMNHLRRLVDRVVVDREVRWDEDGTAHFIADGGLPMALRHWPSHRMPLTAVDPVNSPGNVNRMNVHRSWIARARPKRMMHAVYLMPQPDEAAAFLCDRLDFRLTDRQRDVGVYLRCEGASDHHNIALFNSTGGFSDRSGATRFHHINYHVTDLDEIMVGRNYMERRGWPRSTWGLGRHRISSALFHYLPCPAGGEAEYGADSDQIDDGWIPRDWDGLFGFGQWVHDMPDFWIEGHDWQVGFAAGSVPGRGSIEDRQPDSGSPLSTVKEVRG